MIKRLTSKKVYLIPAVVSLIGFLGIIYFYFFTGFSSASDTHYIYIDGDDDVDSVCTKLSPVASAHGMSALRTLLRYGNYADRIRTGRYAIKPDDGVIGVFRMLRNGQQTPIMLTIPESRTMDRLASVLSRKLMLDSTTIVTALTIQESAAHYGYDTCTIACMFVPNTYEVYWDISIDRLLERMKKEHDVFWNYDRLHKAEAIGLTPNEVCTLASIIDEETSNNDEKPMIAGMYLNRLAKDMPLQADPTVKFALRNFELRRIYHAMLNTQSPYNTYANTGLPPGPIKIASIKGIDAVLNRVAHDYLYMCAKEDFSGTHNFARTYKEHLQNAARYSKALNQRGIQ